MDNQILTCIIFVLGIYCIILSIFLTNYKKLIEKATNLNKKLMDSAIDLHKTERKTYNTVLQSIVHDMLLKAIENENYNAAAYYQKTLYSLKNMSKLDKELEEKINEH